MNFLLDTNSCIYLFVDAYPRLTQRVAACPKGSLAVSAISYAEILWGTQHGKLPTREQLDGFLEEIIFVDFGGHAAEAYAALPFERGSYDRLIGAHAISLDIPVVTRNVADFGAMPGVRVEDWTR